MTAVRTRSPVLRDDIAWCATVLSELDMTIQMQPGGVWGKQARDARMRVNAALHKLLSKAEATVEKALPTEKVQGSGRHRPDHADAEYSRNARGSRGGPGVAGAGPGREDVGRRVRVGDVAISGPAER